MSDDAQKAAEAYLFLNRHSEDTRRDTFITGYLKGYSAAQTWRPIETAPRDGSRVLVRVGVSWPMFASFRILDMDEPPREEDLHHYKKEWRAARGNIVIPTGWLPLPPSE